MKTRLFQILALGVLFAASVLLYPQVKEYTQVFRSPPSQTSTALNSKENKKFYQAGVLAQTIQYLEKNYYDTKALDPNTLLRESMFGLSTSVPEIVVLFPEKKGRFTVEVNGKKKSFNAGRLDQPSDIVPIARKVFEFIGQNYQGDTKFEDMEYAAINNMLRSLDPHSALLPPKIFNEFKTQTEGEFGGIGIVIGLKDGELTVISPLPNTPASRAGLKSKDKIVQIDDEASINMNLTEAVERLRGKVGTDVTIALQREGVSSPFEVTLTRAKIKIESVQSKLVSHPEGDIGIIRVKSFQEETLGELKRHLRKLKASNNFKGLILDLRNNPGGLLNQAVDMADLFLEQGTIVLTAGANNQILEINRAHSSDGKEDYPLVILVNEGSASASEIVAGAIKKNDRGVIIGNQTFGKGSVQSVYGLKDGSALKITVAQYLTPGKASIQSVGITPDIKMVPMTVAKDSMDIVESETFGEKDLEKHLESSLVKHDQPLVSLEYYQPKAPGAEEEEPASTFTQEINPEEDYQLQFAEKILLNSQGKTRKEIMKEIIPLIRSTEGEEHAKLNTELEKVGVDWSVDPVKKGKPQASVTFNVQSSAGSALKAGEEVQLELKVRNIGDAPFYRLVAVTESEHFLLKNREFIFGKVGPGETKSWTVPIKVPANALRREDTVTFSFQEANGQVPENFKSVLITEPLNRPTYAYQMEILDNGKMGSQGNGNGKPDVGEKVVLDLRVENQGFGKSQDTIVNLKNLEGKGIFISKGREKLKELLPQSSKDARLSFKIDSDYAKKEAELEITILDNESQEVLRDKITFPVGSASTDRKLGMESGPRLTLENHPFPTKTKQKKISISGNVKDPSGLKDLSVFVGDHKAYLKTFSTNRDPYSVQESSFLAPVPLNEKENNLITIMVRDRNNLITRRSFYIYQE